MVFVIRPQQRRVRAHQAVVAALCEGDDVMTTSGILGTIKSMDGDVVQLEVAPGIELRVREGRDRQADGTRDERAGCAATMTSDADTGAEAASAAEE